MALDKLRDKLINNKYINIVISYKEFNESNITFFKITSIYEISKKPDMSKKPSEHNIVVFIKKEDLDKFYISRVWSYKTDNFVCVEYIRKLEHPVPYTFSPLYHYINTLPFFSSLNYSYNKDTCYEKISKKSIALNSHNDDGLYIPYTKNIYYGLVNKISLNNYEPIIQCIGMDKEKLLEICKINNNECNLSEIPYISNTKNETEIIYGYIPNYSTCFQGLIITSENIKNNELVSYNGINMYEYYEDGILNG